MASPKKPSPKGAGSPPARSNSKKARLPAIAEKSSVKGELKVAAGFDGFNYDSLRPHASDLALADQARTILAGSIWGNKRQGRRSGIFDMLIDLFRKRHRDGVEGGCLKPGDVAGELAIDGKSLQAMVASAAGAKDVPRTVWSDGTNELLVEIADITAVTLNGLVQIAIPVSSEETGPQQIVVTFATGSTDNPAGLVFATETVPEGPTEIVAIWGEALVALAWTAVLKTLATLADAAGSDQDGTGLIPAGLTADSNGVKLLVMARHEMDRIVR